MLYILTKKDITKREKVLGLPYVEALKFMRLRTYEGYAEEQALDKMKKNGR